MRIIKNRHIILLIIAFFALLIGSSLFFVSNFQTKKETDAMYVYVDFYFKAYWRNPGGEEGSGNYKNTSGDYFSISAGRIYENGHATANAMSCTDLEGLQNTTLDTSDTVASYRSYTDDSPIFGANYRFHLNLEVYSGSGFYLHSTAGNFSPDYSGTQTMWQANIDEDVYAYAWFTPYAYDVVYDANGGAYSDGSTTVTKNIYLYERHQFPAAPTRPGYTFRSWMSEQFIAAGAGSYQWVDLLSTSCFDYDFEVIADWTPNEYTIYFDKQGGTGGSSSQAVTYSYYPKSITVPTKTGYTFQGYYTGTNGGGTKYYNSSGSGTTGYYIVGDTTLYAYWTPETYYITFDANAGTCATTGMSVTYDTSVEFPRPTREGYIFTGWLCNGSTYHAGAYNPLQFDLGDNGANVTFIAQWQIEKYTLTFDGNSGIATSGSLTEIEYNKTLNSSSDPPWPSASRTGYIFNGWYREGTTTPLYLSSYTVPDLTPGTEGTTTVNFIASWTAEQYVINFNGGLSLRGVSGTPSKTSLKVTYDQTYNSPTWPTATLTGYLFNGWVYDGTLHSGTSYTANQDFFIRI